MITNLISHLKHGHWTAWLQLFFDPCGVVVFADQAAAAATMGHCLEEEVMDIAAKPNSNRLLELDERFLELDSRPGDRR